MDIREQELEQRLRTAMDHAAPDALDRILASCEAQKGIVIPMEQARKPPPQALGFPGRGRRPGGGVLCLWPDQLARRQRRGLRGLPGREPQHSVTGQQK